MNFDVIKFSGDAMDSGELHGCAIMPWCGVLYEIVFMCDGSVVTTEYNAN